MYPRPKGTQRRAGRDVIKTCFTATPLIPRHARNFPFAAS